MSLDLEGMYTDWLIAKVKRTKNTYEIIKHLRRRQEVRPELALLIADILEGKIKAALKLRKRKKALSESKLSSSMLEDTLGYYKDELKKPRSDPGWGVMCCALKQAGHDGMPKGKYEITQAAKLLTCLFRGLTCAQLDAALGNRQGRKRAPG